MKKLLTLIIAILFALPIISQVEKKVIIEHFTNSRCGVCASRNPAFYATLAEYPEVLHIAYHPSSPYSTCFFSQHNPSENDLRTNNYGIFGGTPRLVIQGEVAPVQSPLINPGQIEENLGGVSDFSIAISKTELTVNSFKIRIDIKRESGNENEIVAVFAGLAEKEVHYNAPNGEDLHHDVFRKIIFNDTIHISTVGQTRTISYEYTTDPAWNENEMFAYAIIQNDETGEVLQAETSIEGPSTVGKNKINETSSIFYPNPTSGTVSIQNEYIDQFISLELYDLLGNKIKAYKNVNQMNISDLPEGIYFVKLTDKNNLQYSTRIIKSNR